MIEQIKQVITSGKGTVDKADKWGVRKLAYRVSEVERRQYVLVQFTRRPELVQEIERRMRVTDMVIKFITVRIDEKLKKIEKRKKQRDKRAARRPAPSGAAPALPSLARQRQSRPVPATPEPPRLAACQLPGSPERPQAAGTSARTRRKERRSNHMAERRGGSPISASQRPTGGDKAIAGKKQYFRRKKVCRFCVEKIDDINYKDVRLLGSSSASAARSRRGVFPGVCAPHQRRLAEAIKQARNIALVPFASAI